MPVAIAGPAALAGAAWFSAKTQLGYDLTLMRGLFGAQINQSILENRDKINVFYDLERHAADKTTANREFLVYQGQIWTFVQAYDIVLKYGTWLKTTYAIAPKEVVAMDFMNSPQFVFIWLGLWSIGAAPAFINYNLTGEPLLHSIRSSTARILFIDPDVKHQFTQQVTDILDSPQARKGRGPVQTVYLEQTLEQQILATTGTREPDSSRSAVRLDLAALIFTSGTTGLPKPGFVSWQKVRMLSGFVPTWLGLKKTDRYYTVGASPVICSMLLILIPVHAPLSYLRRLPRLYCVLSHIEHLCPRPSLLHQDFLA